MRFTTAFVAGLFAVAYAQETTISSSSSSSDVATATVSIDPAYQSILNCLDACDDGDVDCQAKCVPVPNPSEEMISANNQCIANCPKGNGTESDNLAYESCQNGCIASYYYTATGVPAVATDASSTNSADGSDSTGSSDSSSTDSADSSSETGSSDDNGSGATSFGVSSAAFGLAAFLAAFVAL